MMKATPRVPAAPDRTLDGRWTNSEGSVLELQVHEDGRITGTFRAASDGSSYRPYRVTGTYTRRAEGGRGVVGSVVGWPRARSITVWTGEYDPAVDELRTSWLQTADPDLIDLRVPSVGGDVFRRVVPSRSMARAG